MAVRFWEYETCYTTAMRVPEMKRAFAEMVGGKFSYKQFYVHQTKHFFKLNHLAEYNQNVLEWRWLDDHRPYYNVYPSILPFLTRLKLTVDSGAIKPPKRVLAVKLPQGNLFGFEHEGQHYEARVVMMTQADFEDSNKTISGLSCFIDIGERDHIHDIPTTVLTYKNMPCVEGRTIEEQLQYLPTDPSSLQGPQIPRDMVTDIMRLCCSLCLLENDPSIIEPDVLEDDREKWEKTHDPKYVEKAHKRHKVGWNIGRSLTVAPHYRGPSPAALYWTGTGRKVPVIRFRRGTIVHREVVEKVPQGFEKSADGRDRS